MALHEHSQRIFAALGACLVSAFALAGPAQADIISATPTLPLLDIPYVPTVGAGCFAIKNICVSGGTLTLTSVVSSTFNLSGQDIVADATYTATLTTLGNAPLGPLTLTGTIAQEVFGRTTSVETGTWTTEISAMSLSGPLQGDTLTLTQDPTNTSSGTTSIVSLGSQGYSISSFFDVFADLSLDSIPPLQTSVGPIEFVATQVPEPAGYAVLVLPVLLLSATRCRRSQGCVTSG